MAPPLNLSQVLLVTGGDMTTLVGVTATGQIWYTRLDHDKTTNTWHSDGWKEVQVAA